MTKGRRECSQAHCARAGSSDRSAGARCGCTLLSQSSHCFCGRVPIIPHPSNYFSKSFQGRRITQCCFNVEYHWCMPKIISITAKAASLTGKKIFSSKSSCKQGGLMLGVCVNIFRILILESCGRPIVPSL